MDIRAEKLAKARKKLRDHQEKKVIVTASDDDPSQTLNNQNHITETNTFPKQFNDNNEKVNVYEVKEKTNTDSNNISNVNVTEILISNKTNLEMQIKDLNSKLSQLEYNYEFELKNNHVLKEKINYLESELNMKSKTHSLAIDEINNKDSEINRIQEKLNVLEDEKNNLLEQLEVTKTILTTKEIDTTKLQNQLHNSENQLEVARLQIQQLTNDSTTNINQKYQNQEELDNLQLKVRSLQQEINALRKEKDNISSHYEHYVGEINEQLKAELRNKEVQSQEIQQLYVRENGLVEQISELEIRLQSYINKSNVVNKKDNYNNDLQEKYNSVQAQLAEMTNKYNELQRQHLDSLANIKELTKIKSEERYEHDNISISKLNADITSDKLAAQRATEQNKKLKMDIEDLEQVVVKMTKDKLDLTEKLTHEKSLNRELILKLTDIEENAKNMNNKLKAKDDEMIRLQSGYKEIERKHGKLLEDINTVKENTQNDHFAGNITDESRNGNESLEDKPLINQNTSQNVTKNSPNTDVDETNIPQYDAMYKLQQRFLKIMDEVANLSDEKQRLEHIILQLQNETDTICEYVALYQQQRSLLKKREEERNNQIQIFQSECNLLKKHLEELRDILLLIVEDKELSTFLRDKAKINDISRIKTLLETLQGSSILDAQFQKLELNAFYPCSCCSGQLIDV